MLWDGVLHRQSLYKSSDRYTANAACEAIEDAAFAYLSLQE